MTEQFAPYASGLVALGLLTLAMVVQSFLAGLYKNAIARQRAGLPPEGDYGDFTFRAVRTHLNGVENFSAIVAAALLAMVAGASAGWVNGLVWAIVILRLAYWPVYYFAMGKEGGGPRTMIYVVALILNIALALVAIVALMQG